MSQSKAFLKECDDIKFIDKGGIGKLFLVYGFIREITTKSNSLTSLISEICYEYFDIIHTKMFIIN